MKISLFYSFVYDKPFISFVYSNKTSFKFCQTRRNIAGGGIGSENMFLGVEPKTFSFPAATQLLSQNVHSKRKGRNVQKKYRSGILRPVPPIDSSSFMLLDHRKLSSQIRKWRGRRLGGQHRTQQHFNHHHHHSQQCPDAERRQGLGRAAPSATARCSGTTSRASPSRHPPPGTPWQRQKPRA